MNKDIFKGQWNQIKGKVKQHWGALTDDEIKKIEGKQDELCGLLQEKYGYSKERAEKDIESFINEQETVRKEREKF